MKINIYSRVFTLKEESRKITTVNPLLDVFNLDFCQKIDSFSRKNQFFQDKKAQLIELLKDYDVGYDEKLKSAVEVYNEVLNYHLLSQKVVIEPVKENNSKTPDFLIRNNSDNFYLEVKTLGFNDGGINYIKTIEDGLESKINIEDQIHSGKRVASAITVIAPLRKDKGYSPFSVKHIIEIVVRKIEQNLKKEQFEVGDTFLLVDLHLIPLPSNWCEASVPIYQEPDNQSMVSGTLWNISFGKLGDRIFKGIEFEGKNNIEGELGRDGIFANRPWIKALCFRVYNLNDDSYVVGFYRSKDEGKYSGVLSMFCDFLNDELNTFGFEVLRKL